MSRTEENPALKHFPANSVSSQGMSNDEDLQWMAELKATTSPQAFRKLYEKYRRPVMSYLWNMVGPITAEEVFQEVFLRVYRSRDRYEPTAKFSTWLWTVARNAALDELRKQDTLIERDACRDDDRIIDQIAASNESAETILIERADRAYLESLIQKLPVTHRDALMLRVTSDLSYEEISGLLNVGISTIKTWINRAKATIIEETKKMNREKE